MPPATNHQRPSSPAPDETAPHMKAHIGGNQVIGFNSSSTSVGLGRDFGGAAGTGAGRVEGTEFSMARGYA
jgi:hypothetical protein